MSGDKLDFNFDLDSGMDLSDEGVSNRLALAFPLMELGFDDDELSQAIGIIQTLSDDNASVIQAIASALAFIVTHNEIPTEDEESIEVGLEELAKIVRAVASHSVAQLTGSLRDRVQMALDERAHALPSSGSDIEGSDDLMDQEGCTPLGDLYMSEIMPPLYPDFDGTEDW
jgi:hypothetical protein